MPRRKQKKGPPKQPASKSNSANPFTRGLGNAGNTCYQNAVFQVLVHAKPFRLRCVAPEHVGYAEDDMCMEEQDDSGAVEATGTWLKRLIREASMGGEPLDVDTGNLAKLRESFRRCEGAMMSDLAANGDTQEDAMEFLSFLLNHTDGLFDDLLETRFDQRIACAVHTEREEPRPVITDNIQVSLTPGGADLELQELLRKEFESREVVYYTGRYVCGCWRWRGSGD